MTYDNQNVKIFSSICLVACFTFLCKTFYFSLKVSPQFEYISKIHCSILPCLNDYFSYSSEWPRKGALVP